MLFISGDYSFVNHTRTKKVAAFSYHGFCTEIIQINIVCINVRYIRHSLYVCHYDLILRHDTTMTHVISSIGSWKMTNKLRANALSTFN